MRNIEMYANSLCSLCQSKYTHTHTHTHTAGSIEVFWQGANRQVRPAHYFFPLVIDSVTQAASALQMDELEMDVFVST